MKRDHKVLQRLTDLQQSLFMIPRGHLERPAKHGVQQQVGLVQLLL